MLFYLVILFFIVGNELDLTYAAMTMKQLDQSMAMFRKTCIGTTGAKSELIDGIHRGEFPDDEKELKCFTHCIAQAAGTVNSKGDLLESKARKQINTILPPQLREMANSGLDACKDVHKNYKDICDKSYYSTKCIYFNNPKEFRYP